MEKSTAAFHLVLGQRHRTVLKACPLCFNFVAKIIGAGFFYQDLDTSFILVIAAALAVVNPQNGVQITQQMLLR